MPIHPNLLRQLREALGTGTPAELDALAQDLSAAEPAGLRAFIGMVEDSYRQFERAQDLRLRSLSESSGELTQTSARLREEARRNRDIVEGMRGIANRMLTAAGGAPIGEADSAEGLMSLLSNLIAEAERARERLAHSEARYRALTLLSSDWYWETDIEGRFTHLSEGAAHLTGLALADCLGRPPWEALGIDGNLSPWPEMRAQVDVRASFRNLEVEYTPPGADTVWFLVSGEPYYGPAGEFIGYQGVGHNISRRKRTEQKHVEALRLTDLLIELTPTPISIKDTELRFMRVNAAFVEMFEIDREQWLGRSARQVLGGVGRGEIEERALIESRRMVRYECERTMTSGRQVHFLVTKAPLVNADGEVTSVISTYSDITRLKGAQRELARELALSEALIESMPMPVSIKDLGHRYLRVNAAFERMFGVPREAARGMTVLQAMPAVRGTEGGEAIEDELLAAPGVRSYTRSHTMPDGEEKFFVITKATTHDADGTVTGFITIHTEITELKLAEQRVQDQLRLTSTLLEASPTPTVVKDTRLVTILCNSAYEALFEVRREHILGKPMEAYRSNFSARVNDEELAMLAHPGMRRDERTLTTPSGTVLHCIVTKSTVINAAGEVDGLITTITDITELKRTERNLIVAKQAAELAARTRSQFLANMSHEIRTPMNGVLGMASVLEGTPLDEEQKTFVRAIRDSGDSLLKIVGDILDFSKIEVGKMDIEQVDFDLRSRLTSITQLFTAAARGKNLLLTCSVAEGVPGHVIGDPVRISQALSNLVANAVKFTARGKVAIEVAVQARAGDDYILRFDVRDTGVGISREAIERIFDPFTQEDASTTRRFGGTGLGLTISRQLAGLMGGEIAVESAQGHGSCFTLTVKVSSARLVTRAMPAAVPDAMAQPESRPRPPVQLPVPVFAAGGASLRVLLAEDNNVNQIVARVMLTKLGCKVEVAKDGIEAVALARAQDFDLVLMDCHMPNLDGFAATAALREMEARGHARHIIIAQTANAMEGDRETCLAAGMDDYLPKPLTAAALADALRRWAPLIGK